MSEINNSSNLTKLNYLKEELRNLEKEKEEILNAIEKVNSYSLSSAGDDSMSNACSTFNYVANNMDNFWEVTDGYVRNSVQERLKKVGKEFSSSGVINSCVSEVMAKAEEKINELDNEISAISVEISSLESILYS